MWALQRAEAVSLATSPLLRAFAWVFRPFIHTVNGISNWMLRRAGLPERSHHETHTADEILGILSIAARTGSISDRELELTENIFRMISLEVRHIIVPRVDVDYLSLEKTHEENLRRLRESGHSRLPLCEVGLDTVVGFVHAKDALDRSLEGRGFDLREIAREAVFVPDTMSVSDFLLELQSKQSHCAVVVDEHGTAIGLAFREDALEEVVGPLGDEFDVLQNQFLDLGGGSYEMSGKLSLPEVCDRLDFELGEQEEEAEDTIGGHVTARLGRLPRKGDRTQVGPFEALVLDASRRRVQRLRLRRTEPVAGDEGAAADADAGSADAPAANRTGKAS
jgi:CBS domain containing-hemolysin-like protein